MTIIHKRPRLGWGKAGRGGGTFEAVLHELKGQMQIGQDGFNGFLELLGLVLVHRGSPVRSPHAI